MSSGTRQNRPPLPNEADTLLLRAALLDGQAAREAYATWRARLDFDALNLGSQRVLGLLHNNLKALGIDDTIMGRLRGVARYAWFSNQSMIAAADPLFAAFADRDIRFIVLKGLALIVSFPGQMRLRPLGDLDILVHPDEINPVVDALVYCGWRPHYGTADLARQRMAEGMPSYGFEAGQNRYLDLHAYALEQCRWPDADAALWQRARPGLVGARACLTPGFEDQVLHACIHGALWSEVSPLRWAADSVVILRAAGATFDWDYLIAQTVDRRLTEPVRQALSFLRDQLEVAVPETAMRRLQSAKVSVLARVEYRLRGRNPAALRPRQRAILQFQDLRRRSRDLADGRLRDAICAWLQSLWKVDRCNAALAEIVLALLGRPPWLRRAICRSWPREQRRSYLERSDLPSVRDGAITMSLARPSAAGPLYGFDDPERDGIWTVRREAALAFRTDGWADALTVRFALYAMVMSTPRALNVEVWVNEHHVTNWRFGPSDWEVDCQLQLPADQIAGDHLVFTFVIRSPRSPKSLGQSGDDRALGLCFRQITFARIGGDDGKRDTRVAREGDNVDSARANVV